MSVPVPSAPGSSTSAPVPVPTAPGSSTSAPVSAVPAAHASSTPGSSSSAPVPVPAAPGSFTSAPIPAVPTASGTMSESFDLPDLITQDFSIENPDLIDMSFQPVDIYSWQRRRNQGEVRTQIDRLNLSNNLLKAWINVHLTCPQCRIGIINVQAFHRLAFSDFPIVFLFPIFPLSFVFRFLACLSYSDI